ncbi:laccase [Lactifluus volemus]|nr:laccase [Lactifluus volemus]
MRSLSLVVFFAVLSTRVQAHGTTIGPVSDLVIVNAQIAPDGYLREATLVNGKLPGPLIRANKHWHGILQRKTNYADGAAFVTQCPIVPNESFLYKFNAEEQTVQHLAISTTSDLTITSDMTGHLKAQYCDGLRGALVIYDPKDPHRDLYDIDDADTVITLGEWYHYSSKVAPLDPQFNSTLINGKGRYIDGPSVPLAVVNVVQGLRYRLRIVSISCDPAFDFSIDGHQLTIIEVDGTMFSPWSSILLRSMLVNVIRLFSLRLTVSQLSANRSIGNYWIRALPINLVGQSFADSTNVAILRYTDAPLTDPTNDPNVNIPKSKLPLKETDLHPFDVKVDPVPGKRFPGGADINIDLKVTRSLDLTEFIINGATFDAPMVPVLLQILSGAQKASDLVPKGSIYGLEPSKSVEISIPAGVSGGPLDLQLDNPVIRDVVNIGEMGDNVTIRFFTDNPGPWFLHCHIDWHLVKGFAVVFAEDVPEVPTKDIVTDQWKALCPAYNNFVSGTKSY